jgi:hypothetical protein
MGAVIPFVGLALGVAGSAMSYSAQSNAAETQAQFSALNSTAAAQQSQQQGAIQAAQAGIQSQQQLNQQQAQNQNAEATIQQTEAAAAAQQETAHRNRDEFTRQLSQAISQQGNSGAVIATGSPLDLLMNAADTEQQQQQDSIWKTNEDRKMGYRQAAGERLGASTAGLNASLFQLDALSSIEAGRMGAAEAKLKGYAGAATAAGMQQQAYGNLIGNAATNFSTFTNTPWAKKRWAA